MGAVARRRSRHPGQPDRHNFPNFRSSSKVEVPIERERRGEVSNLMDDPVCGSRFRDPVRRVELRPLFECGVSALDLDVAAYRRAHDDHRVADDIAPLRRGRRPPKPVPKVGPGSWFETPDPLSNEFSKFANRPQRVPSLGR